MTGYDTLYQQWLKAKRDKSYIEADRIREDVERLHKLTIFAEGEMPIIGVTVRKMQQSSWEIKYGNPKVGKIMRDWESSVEKVDEEWDYEPDPDSITEARRYYDAFPVAHKRWCMSQAPVSPPVSCNCTNRKEPSN